MKLYFGGAEVPSHKKTLEENGVTHVYLSYMGLRRRVKFKRPWLIKDKFPEHTHVLLESGTYTVNRGVGDQLESSALVDLATAYMDFVSKNADRVDAFTEFDALALGRDWLNAMRTDFYDDYGDKFMPVWHAEYGIDELENMASKYRHIAILQTALGDRDLIPTLNLCAVRRGTLFHGLAMTKPDIMSSVRWDSVGSTSWISPMQFGDTQIWTGSKLQRYPKDYKEKGRTENRALIERLGLDADKILADDRNEVAKLTLWSWNQVVDDINRKNPDQYSFGASLKINENLSPGNPDLTPAEAPVSLVGQPAPMTPLEPPTPRRRVLLPGVDLFQPEGQEHGQLNVRGDNLRRCDTCILRDRGCPGYQAGAECVYTLPIMVKTVSDVQALEAGLISMQTQRVMFIRMQEDLEGGGVNVNLSSELDRLTRMIKLQREGRADRFNINISGSSKPGEPGILGSMFGSNVADAQQIEQPSAADSLIKESLMGQVYDITEVTEK
jgi:hypothetical protein